jgi:CrcB protein
MTDHDQLVRIESVVLVALGGFVGANLRYALTVVPTPGGTLAANVLGSTLLGFTLYEALYSGVLSEATHRVLATGVLSSLTTYSTFALETVQLAGTAPILGLANALANYVLGFASVLLGRAIAGHVEGR